MSHPETNPHFIRPLQQRRASPHPEPPLPSPNHHASPVGSPPKPQNQQNEPPLLPRLKPKGQRSKPQGPRHPQQPQTHPSGPRPDTEYHTPWLIPSQHEIRKDEHQVRDRKHDGEFHSPWMGLPHHQNEGPEPEQQQLQEPEGALDHYPLHPRDSKPLLNPKTKKPQRQRSKRPDGPLATQPKPHDHKPKQDHYPLKYPDRSQIPASQRTGAFTWLIAAFCALFWILVFLGGLIVLILYLVYRPKSPKFDISSATLNAAYVDAGTLLNADISILANFTNPNKKAGVQFSHMIIDLYYGNKLIATQYIESFSVAKGHSMFANVHTVTSQVRLPLGEITRLQEETNRNAIMLNVKGVFRVRSNLGSFLRYSYRLYSHCTIMMSAPPGGVLRATLYCRLCCGKPKSPNQMVLSALFIWLPLMLLLPLYLLIRKNENKPKLPSPPRLPILGNLHQLSPLLHKSYWQLSNKYGPVMLVHIGQIQTVVVSSAEAARDVLRVHDLACCSRPSFSGAKRLSYNFLDISVALYSDNWRYMKKLIVLELFSPKRVQSFRFLREQEVEIFINSISDSAVSGSLVDLTDKLFALSANNVLKMSFGFEYQGTEFDKERFHEVIHEVEAVAGSFSNAELFPYVGWIMDWLTHHHEKTERVFREMDSFLEYVINDHLKPGREKTHDDMIDVLLRIKEEQEKLGASEFTTNNIKGVLVDLFVAGTDTQAITLNWAMVELIRNPRVMQKVQEEVRNHIGSKGKVTESELEKLEYLKLVIKETLRMHPPAPLLLARETLSHCNINGYELGPQTMIQVNAWAIGRDPKYWKEPEKFYPERFIDSSIDYKGQHFEFLPFAAGRRMCPGMHMGIITIENVLANLLYWFDWKLPEGMRIEDLNMEEKAGFSLTTTKKKPLILVPVKRLQ